VCETFSMLGETKQSLRSIFTGRRLLWVGAASLAAMGIALAQAGSSNDQNSKDKPSVKITAAPVKKMARKTVQDDQQLDPESQKEVQREVAEAMKEVQEAMKEMKLDMADAMKDMKMDMGDLKDLSVQGNFKGMKQDIPPIHVHVPAIKTHVPGIHIRIPAMHLHDKNGKPVDIPEIKVDVPDINVDVPDIHVDIPAIHVDVPPIHVPDGNKHKA